MSSLPANHRYAPMATICGGTVRQRERFIDSLRAELVRKGKSVTQIAEPFARQFLFETDASLGTHLDLISLLARGEVLLIDFGDKYPECSDDTRLLWKAISEYFPSLPFQYIDHRDIDLDHPDDSARSVVSWCETILSLGNFDDW